jgi:hypothetical protein
VEKTPDAYFCFASPEQNIKTVRLYKYHIVQAQKIPTREQGLLCPLSVIILFRNVAQLIDGGAGHLFVIG